MTMHKGYKVRIPIRVDLDEYLYPGDDILCPNCGACDWILWGQYPWRYGGGELSLPIGADDPLNVGEIYASPLTRPWSREVRVAIGVPFFTEMNEEADVLDNPDLCECLTCDAVFNFLPEEYYECKAEAEYLARNNGRWARIIRKVER